MKKIISAVLCAALAVSSAAVTSIDVSADTTSPNYESYIKSTLNSKYSQADLKPISKLLYDYPDPKTKKYPEENRTWAKRTGIAGYEIADMDGDGSDDMILYVFDKDGKDNSISIEYYTADKNGKINKTAAYNIYKKDEKFLDSVPLASEQVVSGIVEKDGKDCLVVETYYQAASVSGSTEYHINYSLYECDDKGNFVNSYKFTNTDSNSALKISERKSDGTYSDKTEKLTAKDNYLKLYSELSKVGLSEPENDAAALTSAMQGYCDKKDDGMKFGNYLFCENLPTYFADDAEKRSFYFYTGYIVGEKFLDSTNITGFYSNDDITDVYEKYVKSTLTPKYGTADTKDFTKTLSFVQDEKTYKYPEENRTWVKRKGIIGYDFADMNGDLLPDMVVYSFEKDSKDNILNIALYSSDIAGDITECGSDSFFEKEEDYVNGAARVNETCYGGIVKCGDKNRVLIESTYTVALYISPKLPDYKLNDYIYECDENGKLVKSYYVTKEDDETIYGSLAFFTRGSDGKYTSKKSKIQDIGLFSGRTKFFDSIGFPTDHNISGDSTCVFDKEHPCQTPIYMFTEYQNRTVYYITNSEIHEKKKTVDGLSRAGIFSNDEIKENFDSYVKNTLVPKYGWADTKEIKASISNEKDPVPEKNFTWAKRKGILGYDIADMSDGIYDMAVYVFDKEGKDNRLNVEFYTADIKGNISKNTEFTIYEKTADYAQDYPTCFEQCRGGLVKKNSGAMCLVTEDYYCPYTCIDYLIDFRVYGWNEVKEEFVNYYKIDQDMYSGVNLYTWESDGSYSKEFIQHKKDEFYKETISDVMQSLYFPKPQNDSSDIGKCLGYNSNEFTPTYFNSSNETRSYYMASYFDFDKDVTDKTINITNITGMFSNGSVEKANK